MEGKIAKKSLISALISTILIGGVNIAESAKYAETITYFYKDGISISMILSILPGFLPMITILSARYTASSTS